jgi:hypothetical protein
LSTLWALVEIDESLLSRVQVGQSMHVRVCPRTSRWDRDGSGFRAAPASWWRRGMPTCRTSCSEPCPPGEAGCSPRPAQPRRSKKAERRDRWVS